MIAPASFAELAALDRTAGPPTRYGYEATEDTNRRRTVTVRSLGEDEILTSHKRKQLNATALDIRRNFAIAAWAIRKHLDYVSTFSFQARTDDPDLNEQIEHLVRRWHRPKHTDRANRHGLRRFIRLAEAMRTIGGDVGILKLASGHIQAIESDRIRTPFESHRPQRGKWKHGVRTDVAGAPLSYAIHRRNDSGGFVLDRIVRADRMILHGYFDRFDQVRGVSPLSSALNSFQDIYENFDYALAKAKLAQLFGLATYREDDAPLGNTGEKTDDDSDETNYLESFDKGPFHVDLDINDKVEILEGKTPATEFQTFTQAMTMVALKALDIPYSFFDEGHTNWSGANVGRIGYIQSCKNKRADNIELLNCLTVWRLALFVLDGDLELPPNVRVTDLAWEWIPDGQPWWDASREARGHLMLLGAGLTSPQRVCMETGTDFYENVDALARAQKYADEKGVDLSYSASGQTPPTPGEPKEGDE